MPLLGTEEGKRSQRPGLPEYWGTARTSPKDKKAENRRPPGFQGRKKGKGACTKALIVHILWQAQYHNLHLPLTAPHPQGLTFSFWLSIIIILYTLISGCRTPGMGRE